MYLIRKIAVSLLVVTTVGNVIQLFLCFILPPLLSDVILPKMEIDAKIILSNYHHIWSMVNNNNNNGMIGGVTAATAIDLSHAFDKWLV